MALTRRVGAAGRLELRPDRPTGPRRRVNPVRLHQTPAVMAFCIVAESGGCCAQMPPLRAHSEDYDFQRHLISIIAGCWARAKRSRRRAAEQREELSSFEPIELHPLPLARLTA